MKTKTKNLELMESPYELWSFLKTQGGLDIRFYDVDLVDELRSRLSLPPTGDFESLLSWTLSI